MWRLRRPIQHTGMVSALVPRSLIHKLRRIRYGYHPMLRCLAQRDYTMRSFQIVPPVLRKRPARLAPAGGGCARLITVAMRMPWAPAAPTTITTYALVGLCRWASQPNLQSVYLAPLWGHLPERRTYNTIRRVSGENFCRIFQNKEVNYKAEGRWCRCL